MKTKMERVEVLLNYYRLRGHNSEKVNELKRKLLKDEQIRKG